MVYNSDWITSELLTMSKERRKACNGVINYAELTDESNVAENSLKLDKVAPRSMSG